MTLLNNQCWKSNSSIFSILQSCFNVSGTGVKAQLNILSDSFKMLTDLFFFFIPAKAVLAVCGSKLHCEPCACAKVVKM